MKTLRSRIPLLASRIATASPQSGSTWRAGASSSTARGYGYRWQQARADYLKTHPLCVRCEALDLIEPATTVDHIKAHQGDDLLFWDRDNWQALCTTCHSRDKQREERAAVDANITG